LTDWLNETFPAAKGVIGIDVVSVREGPAIYRVMNAEAPDASPSRFRRFVLRGRGPYDETTDMPITVAGDINANFWVDEIHAAIRHATSRTGGNLPTDAAGVAGWLAVVVRSVSDLYRSLEIGRTIGGDISTVVLDSKTMLASIRTYA
jgi:hypothetical protein